MIIGNKYRITVLQLLLCALPFLWLWFVLINHLRVEWTLNPQYSYGWAVPFLCVFLLWQRIRRGVGAELPAIVKKTLTHRFLFVLISVLALAYLPTRLIQEANPDWRLVSWGLAIEVIGLTLCLLQMILMEADLGLTLRDFIFPICFFLVAVPWATVFESPIIQSFTRMDVAATTEIMGILGIPAIPHGNVIEVATGVVGIDEACSGIRSFQATLMVSLFLGEWLRLGWKQRWQLVLSGFLFSLLFNFMRLCVLVAVASRHGIAAVSRWHDPTGVTILLGCLFGLWFLAHWFARKNPPATAAQPRPTLPRLSKSAPFPTFAFFGLAFWLLIAETCVTNWYRYHEARMPAPVTWDINWPLNLTMRELPIAPETRQILRYDEAASRAWQADDHSWQVVYLRWNPGSVATRLTYNHTPEVCLTASGHRIAEQSEPMTLTARGLEFSFRFYRLGDTPQPVFVGYCLWEDRAVSHVFNTAALGWGNRLGPVLEGQRNTGQRSIELVLTGVNDFSSARDAVEKLLNNIVAVGNK
jgi:exosortase